MLGAAAGVFLVGVGGTRGSEYLALVPGILLFGFGAAVALPSMTAAIMASATALRRGMVSGVYNTARLVGGTLGLAVMGSVLATLRQQARHRTGGTGSLRGVEETPSTTCSPADRRGAALDGLSSGRPQGPGGRARGSDSAFAATLKLSARSPPPARSSPSRSSRRLRAPARAEVRVETQVKRPRSARRRGLHNPHAVPRKRPRPRRSARARRRGSVASPPGAHRARGAGDRPQVRALQHPRDHGPHLEAGEARAEARRVAAERQPALGPGAPALRNRSGRKPRARGWLPAAWIAAIGASPPSRAGTHSRPPSGRSRRGGRCR